MNAAYLISGPWVERLGWTLIHFLWQGVVILAVYTTTRRLFANTSSPNARYLLACAALGALLAAPLMTFGLIDSAESIKRTVGLTQFVSSTPVSGPVAAIDRPTSWISSAGGRESTLTLIVMIWLVGATAFWMRLMGGWVVTARMRSTKVRSAPPQWQQILRNLSAKVGLSRPVHLLVSARVQVPTVVGWLRPLVLVPIGALSGLPSEHVEVLLIHELAHIRRHDYLVNILQGVAEALLFYHPAVWWVSRHIRTEREFCCDDIAVSVSGDALTYARALAELESSRPAHLHAAIAANGNSLAIRIARLFGEPYRFPRTRPGPSVIVSAILLVVTTFAVFGQAPTPPRFDVMSIKPSTWPLEARGTGLLRTSRDGRLTAEGGLLGPLTSTAYGLRRYQIVGGPDWINATRYDIEAKAEGNPSPEQVRLMLKSLLEDRFKLKVHRETQIRPAYILTVASGGPKVEQPKDGSCVTPGPNTPGTQRPQAPGQPLTPTCGHFQAMVTPEGGRMDGGKASMEEFATVLSNMLGRTVINRTGFTETFDAHLVFRNDEALGGLPDKPEGSANPANLPIFVAIQEQLGLKLEPGMSPLEVLVIDNLEKPTEN